VPKVGEIRNLPSCVVIIFRIYFIIQLILPLRPYVYPGNSSWNRGGKRFSWHLMLDNFNSKMVVYYTPTKKMSCPELQPFNGFQAWWMSGNPEAIQQYVQYLRNQLVQCGVYNPEIFVDVKIALNGRDYFPLIDPNINLADEIYPVGKAAYWVMPHPDHQKLRVEQENQYKGLAQYEMDFSHMTISF